MKVRDRVVVITGGGSGIGAALARRFAADGAARVVVVDRSEAASQVAAEVDGVAELLDVTDPAAMNDLMARTVSRDGRIDLFCSNAGVTTGAGLDDPIDAWQSAFDVNVLAHVHAARAVVPVMLEQGSGYLLNTASAAGLLTSPGDGPYAVTKHAAVAFAEWLAVEYGDRIGVSVLCPLGVATPLLMDPLEAGHASAQVVAASGRIISVEDVADAVVEGLAAGRFLILPHPEVATYWAQKASDPDRWLAGVRRLTQTRKA